jgi:hypothetical protein
MERTRGDAREIAAWQIGMVIGNYVFESLQHLVTKKSIPVQILSIRSFRLAGVFFKWLQKL